MQEHVTTTCALCIISKRHKQRRFHSASPWPCLEFSLPRLGLELSASASALPRLRTLLPRLASSLTCLPWPLPWQNCLEPAHPWKTESGKRFLRQKTFSFCRKTGNQCEIFGALPYWWAISLSIITNVRKLSGKSHPVSYTYIVYFNGDICDH